MASNRRRSINVATAFSLVVLTVLLFKEVYLFYAFETKKSNLEYFVICIEVILVFGAMLATLVLRSRVRKTDKIAQSRKKKIRASERKFKYMVESSLVGILLIDRNGKIKEVNPSFLKLTDFSREELIAGNKGFSEMTPKESYADMKISMDIVAAGGVVDPWEQVITKKDETQVSVLVAAAKLPQSEDQISVYVLDLTDRKKAERTVLEQQAQVSSSAKMSALGELASGLAHEINNPLAIIIMTIASMRTKLNAEEFDKKKMVQLLDRVDQTGHRLSKIIKTLRTFARDASQDPIVPVSIKNILTDVFDLTAARFRVSQVDLKFPIEDLEEKYVDCRSVEIVQVLLNLVNNAHDAAMDSEEKYVEIKVVEYEDAIGFCVIDSGPGVPQHLREKIFEPFFTTKLAGVGTGLGLSISKGIVEKNEGKLFLDLNAQKTTFSLTLNKSKQKSLVQQKAM